MSLICELIKKYFLVEEEIDFSKFPNNKETIEEIVAQNMAFLRKDVKKKLNDYDVMCYKKQLFRVSQINRQVFLEQFKSEEYASIMAEFIDMNKIYALYLLFAEKKSSIYEQNKIKKSLLKLRDAMLYTILHDLVINKKVRAFCFEGRIYYLQDIDSMRENVMLINEITRANNKLIDSFDNEDPNGVFEIAKNLNFQNKFKNTTLHQDLNNS